MRAVLMGFCLGVSLLLTPLAPGFYPPLWVTLGSFMLGLAGLLALGLRVSQPLWQQYPGLKFCLISLLALLGVVCGFGHAHYQLELQLAQQLDRQTSHPLQKPIEQTAIIKVIGISDGVGEKWRQVVAPVLPSSARHVSSYWLLYSQFDGQQQHKQPAPAMQPGEFWQVRVKLKPPHGHASFGAFDSEKWLLTERIVATGTLQSAHRLTSRQVSRLNLDANSSLLDEVHQLRLKIRQHFLQFDSPARGVLLGLLTGDRSLISADTTRLYQHMGISHLLAISGPHVLLAALVMAWLWQRLLNRCSWLFLIMERRRWVLPVVVLGVVGYALLAGFDIPAVRTVMMVLVIASLHWWRQHWRNDSVLLVAASLLLLLDPLAVLSAAFWLSFGAVAMLLILSRTTTEVNPWLPQQVTRTSWHAVRQQVTDFVLLQWRIFVLLSPLVIWCFATLSWLSPLVNVIAIPLLSLVIVPLNMLALVVFGLSAPAADWLWQLALGLLELFHAGLLRLSGFFPQALQPLYLSNGQFVALWLGLLLLVLPKGVWPRWWLAFLLVPLCWPRQSAAPLSVHVLDVGQGLSVLLTTANHAMLVDTGARMPAFDVGEQVVLPALRAQGIRRLDKLMLTHLDNDHSGGAHAILHQMPVLQLTASAPFNQVPTTPCQAGQRWVWDGVVFSVLSPLDPTQQAMGSNENSCVLRVETPARGAVAAQRILIMGDAGFYTEFLLQQRQADLRADLLVLGHHGSKHSSASAFLQAVRPQRAIVSAGYLNRYAHPDPVVLARLAAQSIAVDSTISSGTLSYELGVTSQLTAQAYRANKRWLQH